ncbi:MAG: AMP-binding protein [Pyrinomonadaceae bacterium]|nr:AMP-binding protein [Pyrinomonadaceae bacterium]
MRISLATYLDDFLSRGNETAFAHKQGLRLKQWSYRDIAKTAMQFARELEARGIQKGDRVLLWAGNSPEWVCAFFGCLLRGGIVVPVDVQTELGFIKRVQAQVDAKLALCDAATSSLIDKNLTAMEIDELSSQIAHHSSEPYVTSDITGDDTMEIVFTSGTTTEPKGVRITQRNLMANLAPLEREIGRYLKWERLVHPVRFLNLLPLSHVFGQFMGIFVPQLLRGTVFFQESLVPAQIIETVKRERVSVVICVPRILDAMREKIELDYEARHRLEKFRGNLEEAAQSNFIGRWWRFRHVHQMFGWKFWAFISGGATINPDTEKFWQRLGFAVIQGYGMTETAAVISINHPFKKVRGSIGKVLPGQEVKLAENGEILVRGENVSSGYWKAEGESAASKNSWFRTGDVGEIDEKGNLYFKGRQKEVIVTSAGMNIYPEDIELVLNRQPEIKMSTVVEIEAPHGPEPLAVLILRDGKASAREVIERANESLAQHQRVRRWAVWPEADFPRTTTHKVRKPLVAELIKVRLDVASHASAHSFSHVPSAGLEKIVCRISGAVPESVDPAAKLGTDLKLDSLGRVELLSALEECYQVELDEAAFTEATTLGEVERLIHEGQQKEAARYPYPRWQQRWPLSWLRILLLYLIVLPLTRLMGRPRIIGKNRLDEVSGPVVFVCNHVSMVDHALVLLALPGGFRRKLAIAMDGELLREWLYPERGVGLTTRALYLLQYFLVVLFFNVFAMPQKSGFRLSFAFAGELMDRGYSLLVFPEGKRTENGQINPFRPGTGLLISKLNALVVPMRIDGLWELKLANQHFARPGQVSLTIGEPLRYSARDKPEVITRDLEECVKALRA